jgi:hypothetical protein
MDQEIMRRFGSLTSVNVLTAGVGEGLRAIRSSDLCYFWFGSLRHLPFLLLAWLFDKRIVIVAGGYDVNSVSEIGYGQMRGSYLRQLVFSMADEVVAVSEITRVNALLNFDLSPDRVTTVPLAIKIPSTPLTPWADRRKQVAFLISADEDMYLVKGLDRVHAICRALPDVTFKLAGKLSSQVEAKLKADQPKNLELLGWLEFQGAQFQRLLSESRAICLPSRMESFGAAAFDGAAMGCVPVGFAVGALPDGLRGVGISVQPGSIESMTKALRDVIHSQNINIETLRSRIDERFSLEKRRNGLSEVFANAMQ